MAPGGLLWSESPIPRQFRPVVPVVGEDPPPAPPLFWWKFDETTGTTATSSVNSSAVAPIDFLVTGGAASPQWGVTPIAPSSSAAVRLGGGVANRALLSNPPLITIDASGTYRVEGWMTRHTSPAAPIFNAWSVASFSVALLPDGWWAYYSSGTPHPITNDPTVHVVAIRYATHATLTLNGVLAYDTTVVGTLPRYMGVQFSVESAVISYDELTVFGALA